MEIWCPVDWTVIEISTWVSLTLAVHRRQTDEGVVVDPSHCYCCCYCCAYKNLASGSTVISYFEGRVVGSRHSDLWGLAYISVNCDVTETSDRTSEFAKSIEKTETAM